MGWDKKCDNVLRLFVEKDQIVKTNEVYTIDTTPVYTTIYMYVIAFSFYCSTNPNVVYTTDENTEKINRYPKPWQPS